MAIAQSIWRTIPKRNKQLRTFSENKNDHQNKKEQSNGPLLQQNRDSLKNKQKIVENMKIILQTKWSVAGTF